MNRPPINFPIRLTKFLSLFAQVSQRQSCRLISQGCVNVNGQLAKHHDMILESDVVMLGEKLIEAKINWQTLMYNKPVGVDCNCDRKNPASIVNHLPLNNRLFPIGRLDKDSRGMLLLTNDGQLSHELMSPDNAHQRIYHVTVDKPLLPSFTSKMESGIVIKTIKTRPCQVEILSPTHFSITLTQGLNRQIRRMCRALDYKVVDLQRVAMNKLEMKSLDEGKWIELGEKELSLLTT